MLINLVSRNYRFIKGKAAAFKRDWHDREDGEPKLFEGECLNDCINELDLVVAGSYEILLANCCVEHRSLVGIRHVFTQVTPWIVEVTHNKLDALTLQIQQDGLYEVTCVRDGVPESDCRVVIYSESRSLETRTDKCGQVFFLDDPAQFIFEAGHEVSIFINQLA